MPIVLQSRAVKPQAFKFGSDRFPVAAGQTLKIETAPGGEEILSAPCPAGKVWSARVIVELTETDA